MEILLIGFEPADTADLLKALPFLDEKRWAHADTPVSHYTGSAGILIFSANSPCFADLANLLNRPAPPVIFQQISHGSFEFAKIAIALGAQVRCEEILKQAQKVKSISAELRHEVRSPIQSIFDGAERAITQKVSATPDELADTLENVHSNAASIYKAIPRLTELSTEIDFLMRAIERLGKESK